MHPKKLLLVLLAAAAIVPPLSANSVVLSNREDAIFYYVTAPISEDFFDTIRSNPLLAQALIKQNALKLSYIPPRGAAPEVIIADGASTIILGFFASPGDIGYPILAMMVPASEREEVYTVDRSAAITTDGETAVVYPWDMALTPEPVRIDGRLVDWTRIGDVVTRRRGSRPDRFVRADNTAQAEYEIDDALFWGRGGTDVASVRAVRSQTHLYLMFETGSDIIRGTSYYLYAHPSRIATGPNRYTLEIHVTGPSGFVYLWEAGVDEPHIVGDYAYDRFFLEARIGRSRLPNQALLFADSETSFDIAAALYLSGIVEEFEVGTLELGAVVAE